MTQMLSAMPIKNTGIKINVNHGIIDATMAAVQAIIGPAIRAAREPKRSKRKPLIGIPANRPTDNAVTICAAVPGEILKLVANTGIVGTTIAHMPAMMVLV